MRVTYTHGSSAWKGSLHMCRFSPSRRLPSHDSPSLAVPARSLRNQSRQRLHWLRHPHDLAELSRPDCAGQAQLRTCIAKFDHLASSGANTGYEPKEFDKITSVDSDTTLINGQNHSLSDFSKTHEREHWPIRCSYSVWILSFARFSLVILFLREKAKKACNRETVARQRKRRERRFFVISSAESKSMKNRRNSVRSHSLQTHKEFYSDERDLRGHLQWRAQQVTFGENSVQRKSHSTEYDMEIQNLERRNSEYALFDSQRELEPQRLQLLEEIHWTEIMEFWTHFCSELKMKNHPRQKCHARSCREFDELRRCCYQEEILKKTTEDWKNPTQHDQESRTVSPLKTQNLLWSWLNEQLWHTYVPHHALITSSSRKPSREVGMPRNARENMSIPGNVFDRPHAQRYSDELHNYSRNLATILGILRTEGIEKIESEEPLQSLPLPCFSVRARRTRLDDKQVLCLWLTMPWVFGLVLKWHDNFELSPLGDASVIPWPNKISEPDREAPSRSLRKGSWLKGKGRKILTLSGRLKNVFSRRQLGLVQEETLVAFHIRMPRETVRTTWNEVEIRKKFSSGSKYRLQYRKWKTQTDEKGLNSLKASPVTKAENYLSMVGKMKNIVVWLSTSSRVSWLQVWKQMHSWPSLPMSTSWWKEQPQREVENKRLKEQLWSWTEKRKNVQGCVSQNSAPMNSILRKVEELGLNASGCIWYELNSGKKSEPHERNPCAPGVEEQPPEETSRQADCMSKVAWNLARKCASSNPTLNYVLFSLHNAEQGEIELRFNGWEGPKPHKRLTATGDRANKRVSTSFCSWSRSVRNSAITR